MSPHSTWGTLPLEVLGLGTGLGFAGGSLAPLGHVLSAACHGLPLLSLSGLSFLICDSDKIGRTPQTSEG